MKEITYEELPEIVKEVKYGLICKEPEKYVSIIVREFRSLRAQDGALLALEVIDKTQLTEKRILEVLEKG